jgi:tetratricopeptide (TPR) repeat protein
MRRACLSTRASPREQGATAVSTPNQPARPNRLIVLPLLAAAAGCLFFAAGCGSLASQGINAEGVRLFDQAQYPQAVQQFHQAINKAPDSPDGYYNLASAYHRMGVLNKSEADLKQAEQYYRMCHDRDPTHQDCYRGLAVLMIEQGRNEEAFQLLADWAARQPTLAAPQIELARLHEEFGDVEKAKQYLVEALAVDHENARALAALGRLREETGDQVQALADYQRSLWHDRFQPEVEARVAALRSALNPNQMMTAPPADGTQVVNGGTGPVR